MVFRIALDLFVLSSRFVLLSALMLVLAACGSPRVQPFQEATVPATLSPNAMISGDGMVLPVRSWLPETPPKAVLVAVHGFNDYSRGFEETGTMFSEKGIAVYAYDQRGFGATRSHGIWPGEKNLIADLKAMVLAVGALHPGVPVYVLGESMGGAVVIVSLADEHFPPVAGAILAAPAVWGKDTMNAFYRMTLWALVHTTPGTQLTGQDLKIQASDNIPMLQRMGRDPMVIKRTRIDAIYGIVGLMDSAYEKVEKIKVPVLLMYGGYDQVIPPNPVKDASERFGRKPTLALYPKAYHMLLRDLDANVARADAANWMLAPQSALPSHPQAAWPTP